MNQPHLETAVADRELILLLNKSDEKAFETLYRNYSLRILQRLIVLVKDEEIAKEILQDVFLMIWEKRQSIDAEKSLRSYLFRIAENKVIDFFRRAAYDKKMRNHLIHVSTGIHFHTEEAFSLKESSSLLQVAVNNLSPKRKKIFILCRMEGKTYEEVGQILGISTGTVNDHMVKALRFIKGHFNTVKFLFLVLLLRIL